MKIFGVSIIIPCYNEESFISDCLESIIHSKIDNLIIEILIVDGNSNDNTKGLVQDYIYKYDYIKLIHNPNRVIPSSMNMGIKIAQYNIIMKMDAHSQYEKDYISKCVNYLVKYKVDNVGGRVIHKPRNDTIIGKGICLVLSHQFGVGNSYFRIGSDKPKVVDTVPFGCFRKGMLMKVNCYDERIHRSEDIVLNHKIKKQGGKIILLPDILIYYKTRSNFLDYVKHNFDNGKWSVIPIFLIKEMPFSLRHLIPLIFALYLIGVLIATNYIALVYYYPLFIYLIINFTVSIVISFSKKSFIMLFILPILFFSLHLSYGIGSITAVTNFLRGKLNNSE